MIALRPRDQHVRDPRPLPHETEAETKTNYCETETETEAETKKVVSRPRWSRDLNIPGVTSGVLYDAGVG